MSNDKFLDPIAIAGYLGITKRRVLALIKKGKLPGYQFAPKVFRVKINDFNDFMERSKIQKKA